MTKAELNMSQLKNIFYAQSGGVTAVINATASAVIATARLHSNKIGKVYAGRNGITGALNDDLIDTSFESTEDIAALKHTPGGAFGSCRYKLKHYEQDPSEYERLIEIFKKYNIGYFFYNGGNDSQDTTNKIAEYCRKVNFPLQCIGIPKTIDNDLAHTDNCPGFGSVAKYVATSIREASFDVAAMAATSTKVFIMEVMGRHAGWIAAAAGLAAEKQGDAPHIILFPEVPFSPEKFYQRVHETVEKNGSCAIVVSEGLKNEAGRFLADSGLEDAFGHHRLGGVAPLIADLLSRLHGYKCHWAVLNYLQRSGRHLASQTDFEQAYATGKRAVEIALEGKSDCMVSIIRENDAPYRWSIGEVALSDVANNEKMLPRDFISEDGFGITHKARTYLEPLIQGEAYPPYNNGLPDYIKLKNKKATI